MSGACAVEGCARPAICRGWCSGHYARWRRDGDPGPAEFTWRGRLPVETSCCVDGCDEPAKVKSRRLCAAHYHRFQRTGDPLGSTPRTKSHGLTGYDYHGCRCDVCKEAKSRAQAELRERLAGSPNTPHGTHNGYSLYSCRCDRCVKAEREYRERPDVRERRASSERQRRRRRWENGPERDDFEHGYSGYQNHGCHCDVCLLAAREYAERAVAADREAVGHARASESRSRWTGPELELIVSRPELSDRELGRMLGRTVKAVRTARYRLKRNDGWISAFRIEAAAE